MGHPDDDAIARRLADFAFRHGGEGATRRSEWPEDILDRAAVRIFEAFATEGVDALLLKGAALARLLYAAHEHRRYIDIDILAAPSSFEQAGATLARFGYRNASSGRGIDEIGGAVVHDQLWLGQAADATYPLQVELHAWLPGAGATPEVGWTVLREHRVGLELAGGTVPVLDRAGQALHLATHAAQHGPGHAKGLQELELALDRWPAGTWPRAADLAARIDATAAFAVGLRLVPAGAKVADALGLAVPTELAWEVGHQHERPRGTFHLDAWQSASGLAGKRVVLRRALVPDRRWMAYEYPWSERGRDWLLLAYALHVLRAPLWAARAWRFSRRRGRQVRS